MLSLSVAEYSWGTLTELSKLVGSYCSLNYLSPSSSATLQRICSDWEAALATWELWSVFLFITSKVITKPLRKQSNNKIIFNILRQNLWGTPWTSSGAMQILMHVILVRGKDVVIAPLSYPQLGKRAIWKLGNCRCKKWLISLWNQLSVVCCAVCCCPRFFCKSPGLTRSEFPVYYRLNWQVQSALRQDWGTNRLNSK